MGPQQLLASLALASSTFSFSHAKNIPASIDLDVISTRSLETTAVCSSDIVFDHVTGFHDDNATHTIISGGIERYYAIQVPPSYNDGERQHWPVIFDFHGASNTPADQADNSQYNLTAQGREYIVVYPQGYDFVWEGPSYANPNINDIQFTKDLYDHISKTYCVDRDRFYASGKSNGGGFVDLLACSEEGDIFSAFAMAAPALYTDTSYGDCLRKRAILQVHATGDLTIPYLGGIGRGGKLPDIDQWVSWWGGRDCGNQTQPVHEGGLSPYNTTSYSCGGFDPAVFHYEIDGGGHCWPSSTGQNFDALYHHTKANVSDCLGTSLNFTNSVLDFFQEWNRTRAEELSSS